MLSSQLPIVVDFETYGIQQRPDYPPIPVGVSIMEPGRKAVYLAWGHPTGNNCTLREAKARLNDVWRQRRRKLFHNGKFDMDVAHVHLGLRILNEDEYEDTLFMAFLHNPHARTLSLKPMSAELLNMPPEERDELHEWIRENLRTTEKKGMGAVIPATKKGYKIPPTKTMAFIAYAPGDLVGRYANGDTTRTLGLYKVFLKYIRDYDMVVPYEREKKLAPILLKNETHGIRVNHDALHDNEIKLSDGIARADHWIKKRLNASELNVDSDEELADAIENAGKIEEWILTDKGNRSCSVKNLAQTLQDPVLLNVLQWRSLATNSVRNFIRPWLAMADKSGGYIFTNWNQVRQAGERSGGFRGARTGRLSSNPNFQNISNRPPELKLPAALKPFVLPYLREFIIPWAKGHCLLNRDYSQQELRILAHYEGGALLETYRANPHTDFHNMVMAEVNAMLRANYPRKPIKNLNFGLIYGMGLALLADHMGVDMPVAKQLKKALLALYPGLKDLIDELFSRGRDGDYIRTWGGRVYFVEPPAVIKGRLRTFEYKLLNVLVQGSAADCTKQAIINHDEIKHEDTKLILNVHDELMISTPKRLRVKEMGVLQDAMEDVNFDILMLSDGRYSLTDWGNMVKCK